MLVPKKDHGSLWTYDLTYHIMVELETIIALATITFVVGKTYMSYILWMKKCLMILSMTNEHFSSEKKSRLFFNPCFSLYMYVRIFLFLIYFEHAYIH